MKIPLLAGSALQYLPAINAFVSAVETPNLKRTPEQKEFLSTASKSSLEVLASNSRAVSSYLTLLQLMYFGTLIGAIPVVGVFATKYSGFVQTSLSDLSKAGISLGVVALLLTFFVLNLRAMSKQDVALAANRFLTQATPTKEVAEALKAAKEVDACETYRKTAIEARGTLHEFDLAVMRDLAKESRQKPEFYQKELELLISKEPVANSLS